ncbi:hypothetical protein DV702_12500 [Sporosarcina sp. PTS2304]|uniref:hypothetical protein n=1 Tax=Sporosarcina sp. PTS2304 TaxID=2283194 RepID=UPI000E0DE5E6|nr:hypothetical protein [Sporosarcina sp. PTS2304]AXI00463.1 hypothetical protein DV702_12500 [Sporosarcina sp. PTS2304]
MNSVWRGLIRKEWIVMKWLVLWLVLLNVLVVCVAPLVVGHFVGMQGTVNENMHVLAGTWFALYTFAGIGILIYSLTKEMKNPEIWLHSPQSLYELVGVKVWFSALVAISTLFFGGMLASLSLYVAGYWTNETAWQGLLSLVSVVVAISLKLLFVMAVGFFFWSIYEVLQPRLTLLTIPITVTVFVTATVLWEQLRTAGFFDWLRLFVPVRLTTESFYNDQTSYFFMGIVPDGIIFSLGSLLFYLLLSVFLIVLGSKLFEEKVRL